MRNKMMKKAVKLLKHLVYKDTCEKNDKSCNNNNNDTDSDNAANEYLEARLMELIASSPTSLESSLMMRDGPLIPPCPDSICGFLNNKIESSFQQAEAQVL